MRATRCYVLLEGPKVSERRFGRFVARAQLGLQVFVRLQCTNGKCML